MQNSRSLHLSDRDFQQWADDGYVICRQLWRPEEVVRLKEAMDVIGRSWSPIAGHWEPDRGSTDPLRRYPRIMQPHVFDPLSRSMLLDPRIEAATRQLLGENAIAMQSMYYFKPPGGKGQALHQDNFYLQVRPQTCLAAWTAVDPATPANGGLYVVPGTQDLEVQCPEVADPEESFTTHFVRPPAGRKPVAAELEPGDVLFFNGRVVHGSRPNHTKDQWRRSFICHYAPESARQISNHYQHTYRFDGSAYHGFDRVETGGPCGDAFPTIWPPADFNEARAAGLVPVAGGSLPEAD